jgi:hypothetical protein
MILPTPPDVEVEVVVSLILFVDEIFSIQLLFVEGGGGGREEAALVVVCF